MNVKNAQLAQRYLQLVKNRYSEPSNEKILGSFITEMFPEPSKLRTEGQLKSLQSSKEKAKGLPTKSIYW